MPRLNRRSSNESNFAWTPDNDFFVNGGGTPTENIISEGLEDDEFCIMTSQVKERTDAPLPTSGIPVFIMTSRRASCDSSSATSLSSYNSSVSSFNRLPQHIQTNKIDVSDLYNADIYKRGVESNGTNHVDLRSPDDTPKANSFFFKFRHLIIYMSLLLYTGFGQKAIITWKNRGEDSLSKIPISQPNDSRSSRTKSLTDDKETSLRRMKSKKTTKVQPRINIYDSTVKEIYNPELPGYKDTWVGHDNKKDIPVFWHVPKAGGSTIKDIVGACHGLTIVNEDGVLDGHDLDEGIKKVTIHGLGDTHYVNVDTTTIPGIKRAIKMGLGSSGLADVIITPFLHDTEHIFTTDRKEDKAPQSGRLFATFRHPVARAVSLFKYLQYADWESTYNLEMKTWSLKQYAQSNYIENNWMTRYLSNTLHGELTSAHLQLAMDILRRKFLVGLIDQLETSMKRFEAFFGWKYMLNPTVQEACRESLFTVGSNANRNSRIEIPEEGSYLYNLIAQQNMFDLELYTYIETLFNEQAQFVEGVPDNYRLIDAHCSKCTDSE